MEDIKGIEAIILNHEFEEGSFFVVVDNEDGHVIGIIDANFKQNSTPKLVDCIMEDTECDMITHLRLIETDECSYHVLEAETLYYDGNDEEGKFEHQHKYLCTLTTIF